MLFLNSWRVSNHIVPCGTNPPPFLFKNRNDTREKLQLNIHSLSVRVSELLEYGRKSQYDARSSDLFSKLDWDNLLTRRKKHKAIVMFKTINDLTPFYLHELFESRSTGYNLRNSEHTLFVPKPRTNYGKRSFSYIGAVLWNVLPQNVRTTCSLSQFKRAIDNLFSIYEMDSRTLLI